MTPTPTMLARAAAAAALVALLGACSTAGHPHRALPAPAASTDSIAAPIPAGRSGTPSGSPDLAKVDTKDPQAVARAALTTIWTVDTDLDTTLHDAEKRALPLYTAQHAAEIASTPPRSAPGAEWTLWASHHAYTTVQIQQSHEDGAPADGPTIVHQRWTITITAHGRDGWTSQPIQATALVILTRAGDAQPWQLDTLTLG